MAVPMDPEYANNVLEDGRGKKRSRTPENWQKNLNKSKIYKREGKSPKLQCPHLSNVNVSRDKKTQRGRGPKQQCCASLLYDEDITHFFNNLYKRDKTSQDLYLSQYMEASRPLSHRNRKEEARKPPIVIIYYVPTIKGLMVNVCARAFQEITQTSRDRLSRLARRTMTGDLPQENRGGARIIVAASEVTSSIISHIKSFKCRESPYGRNKSKRSYLPPQLSIARMWRLWKDERQAIGRPVASYAEYIKIFCTKFNLGFGNPRQDICGFCEENTVKLKLANTDDERQNVRAKQRLHKLRAKKFYAIMREKPANTVTVVFNMQQNQPLPKLSVNDVFYVRQVWLYNLIVMLLEDSQTKQNTYSYVWTETESGKGSNEVTSALCNFLKEQETRMLAVGRKDLKLRLFSDSCSGQNKNTAMIAMISAFIHNSSVFESATHYFPIRGHSYMPPDRVFGRIELVFRKHEKITTPQEYHAILDEHVTVKVLGKDWNVQRFKKESKKCVKVTMPFNLTEQRVLQFKSNGIVGVQNEYCCDPTYCSVTTKAKAANFPKLLELALSQPSVSHVKPQKANDVKKLMRFFDVPVYAKHFYDTILASATEGNEVGAANSDVEEYDDTEPYI